jgi:SAM-dependent methyltransferase
MTDIGIPSSIGLPTAGVGGAEARAMAITHPGPDYHPAQGEQGTEPESRDGLNSLPIPPRELIQRTDLPRESDSDERLRDIFERTGAARLRGLRHALPDGFDLSGKCVLDFGCGGGRVLRQLAPCAGSGEFWGCDTYEPTIAWLSENLSPPFRFYVNDRRPMPHPEGYFDLAYAISVFTHITHEWTDWLLELHRVLKPDGQNRRVRATEHRRRFSQR